MNSICRDCLIQINRNISRCPNCNSPRILSHPELFSLSTAHIDCDAFYASVEKRDNPSLKNKPLIIGGGQRGVVSTACYIARIKGVRSAMPMFKALKLCPEAIVVAPRMDAYAEASKEIHKMMNELSPSIEPLSLDEAFIDLKGTEKLHGEPPALSMARLVQRIESELKISASIGLSYNKYLAKLASDLDKPRGFSVIGKDKIEEFLAPKSIGLIWGVGKVAQSKLEQDGIRIIADLQRRSYQELIDKYQNMGDHLWHLCRGIDNRNVSTGNVLKSISKETTFLSDINSIEKLDGHIWRLSDKVSQRAKTKNLVGYVITLKIKTKDFKTISRRKTQREPTQIAEIIYAEARRMLNDVIQKGPFRLIGVGISNLKSADNIDQLNDFLKSNEARKADAERATDLIKKRFGNNAILKGRSLR